MSHTPSHPDDSAAQPTPARADTSPVAGRMSRYDGARQGRGGWLIGAIIPMVALALGASFGNQHNVLDRVNLPNPPISTDQLGRGAAITAVAVLALTLVAAVLNGKAGHHHDWADRAAWTV